MDDYIDQHGIGSTSDRSRIHIGSMGTAFYVVKMISWGV